MKLLLHTCCGPCSIKPFLELKKEFDSVTGLFYNPNIHPYLEYKKRLETIKEFASKNNFELIEGKYDFDIFLRRVVNKEAFGARCEICYRVRLEETARFAKDNGFDVFTTTLLISPYQNQDTLKKIGEELAKTEGVRFLARDFRNLFKESQSEARARNLYRQNYCGCIYSQNERYNSKDVNRA